MFFCGFYNSVCQHLGVRGFTLECPISSSVEDLKAEPFPKRHPGLPHVSNLRLIGICHIQAFEFNGNILKSPTYSKCRE